MPQSIDEARMLIRSGETSSTLMTEEFIRRANQVDEVLGCYIARFNSEAMSAAQAADRELADGHDRGPLHGIPIAIKDIIAAREGVTTAQSLVQDRAWGARRDAPVVARLRKAGAIILGKTTTMEFAAGMPDVDKPFPSPRNPWNSAAWAGGSSSGSASGIAMGLFLGALGTDTGGSLRLPAAYCGVTALMPTFGVVPKSGCIPLAYSLDRVGPLATSALDCGHLLRAIAGPDAADADSVDATDCGPGTNPSAGDLNGARIGYVRLDEGAATDGALRSCYESALAIFVNLGATLVEVTLPHYEATVTANLVTMAAEAFAYHRQDLRAQWDDYFVATRALLSPGCIYSAADYVQAQRVRSVTVDEVARLFRSVDVIVGPTASAGAPIYDAHGGISQDSVFAQIYTVYWNGVGNPVMALPMGMSAEMMPLSLQIAGPWFHETKLLHVAQCFQATTAYHQARPVLEEFSANVNEFEKRASQPTPQEQICADQGSVETVSRALEIHNIHPSAAELASIAAASDQGRSRVERLYEVPNARYALPALRFSSRVPPPWHESQD